jgi:hypothetical protein
VKQFLPHGILPRLLAALSAALLLLGAGFVAACGDEASGEDLNTVLSDTFGGKKQIDSGRIDVDLTADLEGLPQAQDPINVKIGGPFESRGDKQVPKLDLEISAGAAGQTFTAGVISTGEAGYVSFQGTDYRIPPRLFNQFARELRRQDSSQNNVPDLNDLGVDPRKWLVDPKDEGTEEVGGVETIHISSDVDVDKLTEDLDDLLGKTGQLGLTREQRQQLPSRLPDTVKKQISESVKSASVDIYTGKEDKILRKLQVKLDFEVAKNLRSQTAGVSKGKVDFTVEVSEVNKPQKVEAPTQARPLSELQDQLNSLGALGGLGATGSSGSGSSNGSGSGSSGGASSGSGQPTTPGSGGTLGSGGGSSSADTKKTRRYLRCVEDAKGVDQINECSSLLK